MTGFHCIVVNPLHLRIHHNDALICEIRELRMTRCICVHDTDSVLSELVPLPLYWQQYARNSDEERVTRSQPRMEFAQRSEELLVVACEGHNASGTAHSLATLFITHDPLRRAFRYRVHTVLRIDDGTSWPVDPNPNHGELEFCNFWARDSFVQEGSRRKQHSACYVERNSRIDAIPHHHLDSSDKHNIVLNSGDRFLWGIEDQNPVIELVSGPTAHAGICAYMWDAHLGYRIPADTRAIAGPVEYVAEYMLSTLERSEAERLINTAQFVADYDLRDIPVYQDGINRFDLTLSNYPGAITDAWPWERRTDAEGAVESICRYDHTTGFDDRDSLQIVHETPHSSAWLYTCLGPAYGQPPFHDDMRYHLSSCIRVHGHGGRARLAIRLHREGQGSVFDPDSYESYASSWREPEPEMWKICTVWTPVISPAPDRIHLMLEFEGEGVCWFDNVLFDMIA